jgi:hypothetical protein
MLATEGNTTFALRPGRLIPVAAFSSADRVAALVAAKGISEATAAVFVLGGAERSTVINLAKRKRVIV